MRESTKPLASILFAAAAAAGLMTSASAADLAPVVSPAPAQGWQFELTAYGWLTALNGQVGVRNLPPSSVNASIGDVLSHLQGAFMGAAYATNGTWSFLGDVMWAKLGADTHLNTPGPGTEITLTQKQFIATTVVGYRLPVGDPDLDLSVAAGARYTALPMSLDVKPGFPAVGFDKSVTKNWIDPVIGVMARYRIDDRWFLNGYADVGGFGLVSQVTTQAVGLVGYNWTKSFSTAAGFRVLYTDHRTDGYLYKMTQYGPLITFAYRW